MMTTLAATTWPEPDGLGGFFSKVLKIPGKIAGEITGSKEVEKWVTAATTVSAPGGIFMDQANPITRPVEKIHARNKETLATAAPIAAMFIPYVGPFVAPLVAAGSQAYLQDLQAQRAKSEYKRAVAAAEKAAAEAGFPGMGVDDPNPFQSITLQSILERLAPKRASQPPAPPLPSRSTAMSPAVLAGVGLAALTVWSVL